MGPKEGTRYMVDTNATIEKPIEEYSAGSGGAGSRSGLTRNQDATGTRPKSRTEDSGRGVMAMPQSTEAERERTQSARRMDVSRSRRDHASLGDRQSDLG